MKAEKLTPIVEIVLTVEEATLLLALANNGLSASRASEELLAPGARAIDCLESALEEATPAPGQPCPHHFQRQHWHQLDYRCSYCGVWKSRVKEEEG